MRPAFSVIFLTTLIGAAQGLFFALYGAELTLLSQTDAAASRQFLFLLSLALFVCTAMIYASVRFLQEWASPLTLLNYLLLGCASGLTLATLLAALLGMPDLVPPYALVAIGLTLLAAVSRGASLVRNARLKPRSSVQSAIGIKHPRIVQKAQGFMGGSFNTREFFHGQSATLLRSVKWIFLLLVFPLPLLCLALALSSSSTAWLQGK